MQSKGLKTELTQVKSELVKLLSKPPSSLPSACAPPFLLCLHAAGDYHLLQRKSVDETASLQRQLETVSSSAATPTKQPKPAKADSAVKAKKEAVPAPVASRGTFSIQAILLTAAISLIVGAVAAGVLFK